MRASDLFRVPKNPEFLEEVSVVSSLGNHPDPHSLVDGAVMDDGFLTKRVNNDLVFLYDDVPSAYLIIRMVETTPWLMELWTHSDHRNKGLAAKLLHHVVEKFGNVFLDREMTPESIGMIERLIARKAFKASIANINDQTITTYNPDDGQNIGMYDMAIAGVDRPVISSKEARNLAWVLSEGFVRDSILQPIIKKIGR